MMKAIQGLLLLAAVTGTVLFFVVIISKAFAPNNNLQYQTQIAQAQAQQAQSNAMEAQAQAAQADAQADMAEVIDETLAIIFLGGSNWIMLVGFFVIVFFLLATKGGKTY